MALVAPDSDNEFGYDFSVEEEELLLQLTSKSPQPPKRPSVFGVKDSAKAAIDLVPGKTESVFGDEVSLENGSLQAFDSDSTETLRNRSEKRPADTGLSNIAKIGPGASVDQDISYPDLSRALLKIEEPTPAPPEIMDESSDDDLFADTRSPLQRFRSYPRKPLTVSDLTSGAWCELQYWYTLTRLPGGRRTRTEAMKQGSKVHQKLEDEVHTAVKIDILSKEDGFGLRLWNLVQGLRTLRDTGLTRELEVWGMVDENLVNGVIDSVSYENPNPEFEEELSSQESQEDHRQSLLKDYFPPKKADRTKNSSPLIYLTDVKTRGTLAPVSKALLRPAKIQLLLYHRFLSEMAAGKLDFMKVFRRYGLDPDDHFSDTFIAQIGSLHDEIFVDAPSSSELDPHDFNESQETPSSSFQTISSSSGPDLLKYRTLRELMSLVNHELELAFPNGEGSLGHMLRVQYVYRADGRELDQHDFPVSRQALQAYLSRYMTWWRGDRKAKGVEIEEAFKCRTCEFAPDCSWRQSMDEDRVRKAQNKIWATRRASRK